MSVSLKKICLETTYIIGYLSNEVDCLRVEELLSLVDDKRLEVYISDFAWQEVIKPLNNLGIQRKKRLEQSFKYLPKVARIGEWMLGFDILAHNDSRNIENTLSTASRLDAEQFLSFAALGLDYFITKDSDYLKPSVRNKLQNTYGFRVGKVAECCDWIKGQCCEG